MKCESCGHEPDKVPAPGSNSMRNVTFSVPEEFVPILTRALAEKSNQAGMYGYGHLANALLGFVRQIGDEVPVFLRGFKPEAWAQALGAHDAGWEIVCVIDPEKERTICIAGFSPDKTREMVLATRFVRSDGDVAAELAALEAFFERRMPRLDGATTPPAYGDESRGPAGVSSLPAG